MVFVSFFFFVALPRIRPKVGLDVFTNRNVVPFLVRVTWTCSVYLYTCVVQNDEITATAS